MSWSTNSTKIAAAFAGLGFKVLINETEIIELNCFSNLRFHISDTSLLRPGLPTRDDLYRGWMEDTLVKIDPTHPFICGMHACRSYEALLDYQDKGSGYALQLVTGTPLYRYEHGIEDPRLKLAPPAHAIVDLPLASAVALVGLPVIDIDGPAGHRRYLLPDRTLPGLADLPLSPLAGLSVSQLLARKEAGKLPLQLGSTQPDHPVIHGYNVTRSYARLLTEIKAIKKRLLVKDPWSPRRALIPENPSSKLEEEVRSHFRIP
jgi:hypothetical protein